MNNTVLYFPTRYFPAISGAELYFQRMAEILSSKYDYKVDIRTSNAIDFKALRNPKGRTIHDLDKYYSKVNKMRLHRYNVNYDCSMEEKIKSLNAIDHYRSLNLPDSCLKMFLHNGPFLSEIINEFLFQKKFSFDLIHIVRNLLSLLQIIFHFHYHLKISSQCMPQGNGVIICFSS